MRELPSVSPVDYFSRGFDAARHVRARGVPVSASIRGVFYPVASQSDWRDPQGTFRVLRSSLCEFEILLAHSDVPEFWRGFVQGFECIGS